MTSTKTRRIAATLAATAALAIVPAAADAATHSTSTSGTASTYDSGATSAGAAQRPSGDDADDGHPHESDELLDRFVSARRIPAARREARATSGASRPADLANYYHDRAIDGHNVGNGDEYYDKYMAVSDDIANQAENAGCVVVY